MIYFYLLNNYTYNYIRLCTIFNECQKNKSDSELLLITCDVYNSFMALFHAVKISPNIHNYKS